MNSKNQESQSQVPKTLNPRQIPLRTKSLDVGRSRADLDRIHKSVPLGRDGRPAEFGRVAAFLLSPAAAYVTGVMLPVDGGMLRSL